MRVLGFCDYYQPDSCGGAERVAREVYGRLAADHGVDLTVVGAVPHGASGTGDPEPGTGPSTYLVRGRDLSGQLGVQLLASRRLPHVAGDLVRRLRPDVLHANSLHFQSTLVAAALARRHHIPLVTTAHLAGGEALEGRLRIAAAGWDQTVGRGIVAASTGLVAVSDAVAAHLRTLGSGSRPVTVAPNGVDHSVFHNRGRIDRRGGPLRVGFVGRLIVNKGPDLFLRAAATAIESGADMRLTVMGDGPMRSLVENMSNEPPLRGRVELTGQVSDIARRMRELDVVVRPSFTEGLPLAVVEAMASGAVVVASDVPGNVELVAHRRTGHVVPTGNAAAFAASLVELDRDRDQLHELAQNATTAAAGYSWDSAAELHLAALRAATADSGLVRAA